MHDTWCSHVTCSHSANQRPDSRQVTNQRQDNWTADLLEWGAEAARPPSKEHVCVSVVSLDNSMKFLCCDWLHTFQWYRCGQVPSLGIGWPKPNESDIQIFHTNGNIYLSCRAARMTQRFLLKLDNLTKHQTLKYIKIWSWKALVIGKSNPLSKSSSNPFPFHGVVHGVFQVSLNSKYWLTA